MSATIKGTLNSFTNGTLIKQNNYSYIKYTSNGTITCPVNTTCDVLIVGAGGNGGYSNDSTILYSGGGGAGEVNYTSNISLNTGTYNITIGSTNIDSNYRISKITNSSTEIIKANGGGDGGYVIYYNKMSENTYTFYSSGTIIYNNDIYNSSNITKGTYKFFNIAGLIALNNNIQYNYLVIGQCRNWFKFNANLNNSGISNTPCSLSSGDIANVNNPQFIGPLTKNQYILLPSNLNFYANQKLSISFWFKGYSNTEGTSFYLLKINSTDTVEISIKITTNDTSFTGEDTIIFTFKYGGVYNNQYTSYISLFNDEKNHHIVWSILSQSSYEIYIDSVKISTRSGNFQFFNLVYTGSIGKGPDTASTSLKDHSLFISDFRILHDTYTLDQIKKMYTGTALINILPTSGGSGGGGCLTQSGALKGNPFNDNSKINDGNSGTATITGNGGSALATGIGYTEIISGNNLVVGKGGTGGNLSTVPAVKFNYGDGGDGNNGQGYQGIVILKILENNISQCLSDVQFIHGGSNPIQLSEYYNGGSYVFGNSIIPSSNSISLGSFRGITTKMQQLNIFTSNGTFIAYSDLSCEILIVAGGGCGGLTYVSVGLGGGGGGGGIINSSNIIPAGIYQITVGLGGTFTSSGSGNGGNSSINNNTNINYEAIGGGGGGGCAYDNGYYSINPQYGNGKNGGNGGGSAIDFELNTYTAGIKQQPNTNINHNDGKNSTYTYNGLDYTLFGGNGGTSTFNSSITGTLIQYSRMGIAQINIGLRAAHINVGYGNFCYGDGGNANMYNNFTLLQGQPGIVVIKILP